MQLDMAFEIIRPLMDVCRVILNKYVVQSRMYNILGINTFENVYFFRGYIHNLEVWNTPWDRDLHCVLLYLELIYECLFFRNEGVKGFYKGLVPNLTRVVPACAICFVVYEKVSAYLE